MTTHRISFKEFRNRFAAYVRADAGLYLFISIYTLAGIALIFHLGGGDRAAYAIYVDRGFIVFGLVMPVIALGADMMWTMHRFDRRRGLAYARVFSAERLARFAAGLLLLQALTVFFGTFTSVKNVLPLLHGGFAYDRQQAEIDAALHFGIDPWRLIQPFLGNDAMRNVVEWNYNVLWFILCYGAVFFVATSPRARAIRTRYMLGFMLVWILVGNVLAGLFLSAGPAFYGQVTGDLQRFADQLVFLARSGEASYSALRYQDYLWMLHETGRTGVGSGIAAFPSVHVALVGFNAFFLYAYSRRLGIAGFVYVAFVTVSSVYLAWHYAIDGYVGLAVAGLTFLALQKLSTGNATLGAPRLPGAVSTAS